MMQVFRHALCMIAALAVVAAMLGQAAPAQASCGDYLTHGRSHGPMSGEGISEDNQVPEPPCHGPNCSRAPSPSPAVPTSVSFPSFDDMTVAALSAAPQSDLLSCPWGIPQAGSARQESDGIVRPPCLA